MRIPRSAKKSGFCVWKNVFFLYLCRVNTDFINSKNLFIAMFTLASIMKGATEDEIRAVAENAERAFESGDVQDKRAVYEQVSEVASDYVSGLSGYLIDCMISGMTEMTEMTGHIVDVSDYSLHTAKEKSEKARWQEIQNKLYFSVMRQCGGRIIKAKHFADKFNGHIADYIDPEEFSVDEVVDFEVRKSLLARWEVRYGPHKGRPKCKPLLDEEVFASVAKEIYRQQYGCDIVEDNQVKGKEGVERSNCYLMAFASASVGGPEVIYEQSASKHVHDFVCRVFSSLKIWGVRKWQRFFARYNKAVKVDSGKRFPEKQASLVEALIGELTGIFRERGISFCRLNSR